MSEYNILLIDNLEVELIEKYDIIYNIIWKKEDIIIKKSLRFKIKKYCNLLLGMNKSNDFDYPLKFQI